METDLTSDYSVMVSPYASIEDLGISIRAFNALKRYSKVEMVADLIRLVETEELREVRNIGAKSIAEIEDIISHVRLTEPIEPKSDVAQDQIAKLMAENEALQFRNADLQRQLRQLADVQASAVRRQLVSGLLHKDALIVGKRIADWLELVGRAEVGSVIPALSAILESSTNVCDELAYVFDEMSTRDITVLISRYGGATRTLDEIGKNLLDTREGKTAMYEDRRGSRGCNCRLQKRGNYAGTARERLSDASASRTNPISPTYSKRHGTGHLVCRVEGRGSHVWIDGSPSVFKASPV